MLVEACCLPTSFRRVWWSLLLRHNLCILCS
jgi:hypothetical protein